MPTNIESFVKTLESEGVDAGKKAAQKIKADARKQAEQIIAEAEANAKKIIEQADCEAEKIRSRMNSSLELATRDAILMLREKLSRQINIILSRNVEQALRNEEMLGNVIREVILAYAKADSANQLATEVNIPKDLQSQILDTVLAELAESLKNQNAEINVQKNLAKAGFEYKIAGSTVEVSADSVTALLAEMIDPELQQFLAQAANNNQ